MAHKPKQSNLKAGKQKKPSSPSKKKPKTEEPKSMAGLRGWSILQYRMAELKDMVNRFVNREYYDSRTEIDPFVAFAKRFGKDAPSALTNIHNTQTQLYNSNLTRSAGMVDGITTEEIVIYTIKGAPAKSKTAEGGQAQQTAAAEAVQVIKLPEKGRLSTLKTRLESVNLECAYPQMTPSEMRKFMGLTGNEKLDLPANAASLQLEDIESDSPIPDELDHATGPSLNHMHQLVQEEENSPDGIAVGEPDD